MMVKVIKSKKGVPTVIELDGRLYTLLPNAKPPKVERKDNYSY